MDDLKRLDWVSSSYRPGVPPRNGTTSQPPQPGRAGPEGWHVSGDDLGVRARAEDPVPHHRGAPAGRAGLRVDAARTDRLRGVPPRGHRSVLGAEPAVAGADARLLRHPDDPRPAAAHTAEGLEPEGPDRPPAGLRDPDPAGTAPADDPMA